MKPTIYYITCKDKKEARKIADVLLNKKLIICAKEIPVYSSFIWKGKIEKTNEILLLLESVKENFKAIEKEIRKIHSYETFVLFEIPVSKTTKDVKNWIKDSIQ
ncbi:MAG: hypothetical protein A3A51_00640 [Candidatus Levybacteria bacterium RIFCSPLOWO2_01_FULL_39_10]|nr:MAG: hypothetical protein A3A51_00640 [Candidatus Levybacteria bacterium RIFCSPLOWO2_01_FULL_39_10]